MRIRTRREPRARASGPASADKHLAVGRDGKPIQPFLRYQVHPDSRIDFSMAVFALPGHQQNGATLDYRCANNQGLRFTAR